MFDYANLPTLALNAIFGYLNIKERVRCKGVCRTWRKEIELREQKSDTLVLHSGPYLWNQRWSETNNRGLMKFENSFEMKALTILDHPLTRELLEKTKKLAIMHFCKSVFGSASNLLPYLGHFKQCEQIEIKNLQLNGTLKFDLPKLKVLVINDSPTEKLVLNCPSLEVLSWNWQVEEIDFQDAKKLKRIICFDWPEKVSSNKLESLESLNLIVAFALNDSLLDLMPNLKQFVIYPRNPQADLDSVRRQQERYGMADLEILPFGFRGAGELALSPDMEGVLALDLCVDELFENYSKLEENSPWRVCIDYAKLFGKFKILPSNFFERFSEPFAIEISAVTNYTHLFEFLRCYPTLHKVSIHFSKVKADRILDAMMLLQPALKELTIVEKQTEDVIDIDFSFMRHFNLTIVNLVSSGLPADFIRAVAAKRGPHFTGISFEDIENGRRLAIYFSPQGVLLFDVSTGTISSCFGTVEELIAYMQRVGGD